MKSSAESKAPKSKSNQSKTKTHPRRSKQALKKIRTVGRKKSCAPNKLTQAHILKHKRRVTYRHEFLIENFWKMEIRVMRERERQTKREREFICRM